MGDVVVNLIIALIVSLLIAVLLCFGAKFIRLRREYTELFIPIIGALVLLAILKNSLDMIDGFVQSFILDIAIATIISQLIYAICRKFGNKATAVKRHWIFIGFSFLIMIASFMIVYFANNIKESIIMADLFFASFLNFVLMIFNMIFYKITKEISFAIRRKKA